MFVGLVEVADYLTHHFHFKVAGYKEMLARVECLAGYRLVPVLRRAGLHLEGEAVKALQRALAVLRQLDVNGRIRWLVFLS